jgi:hypothetical protein
MKRLTSLNNGASFENETAYCGSSELIEVFEAWKLKKSIWGEGALANVLDKWRGKIGFEAHWEVASRIWVAQSLNNLVGATKYWNVT